MLDHTPPLTISREDFLKDGSDQLFREAIYTLVLSVEKLLRCRSAFARILGLTSSQFAVLMGVASQQKSKGVTIKALAEHVALAPTHVTTEIGRLEAKGLLAKRSNKTDRRSVLVSLTPKGEMEIARVTPVVRETNDLLFRNVGLNSLVKTHLMALKVVANSEEALVHVRHVAAATSKTKVPRH
ncbi:MarR family winged helix-turn-helix transcriptional regulator [Oryzicola mucosus]|uniref:MarR family transcriptional regulator n=1 Tax=Oryzicola mucosus TaxID=2767425 RepID=A0A8J6Q5C4_9HYPH|nr:MarR family transcriptional regulator [Oryzicola mucosus]MBD0417425.1 MarR family transcriptional regulator [Oryzicola mucosus]